MAEEWISALRASRQGRALPVDQLSVLSALLRPSVFSPGEVISEDLSNAPCLGLIQRGVVSAWLEYPDSTSIGLPALAKGAVVGSSVAGRDGGVGRVLRAQEPTIINGLTCDALVRLEQQAPEVFIAVMRMVIERTSLLHQNLLRAVAAVVRGRSAKRAGVGRDAPMHADRAGRYHGLPRLLDQSPFWSLDDHALVGLSAVAPLRHWVDRSVLIGEGQRGSRVLLIARGRVDLLVRFRGHGRRLGTAGPGIAIGSGPVLRGERSEMSFRARGEVVAYDLHRTVFERIEEQGGKLGLALAKELVVGEARITHVLHKVVARLSGKAETTPFSPPSTVWSSPTMAARTPPVAPRASNSTAVDVRSIMDDLDFSTEEIDRLEVVFPDGVMTATENSSRLRRA